MASRRSAAEALRRAQASQSPVPKNETSRRLPLQRGISEDLPRTPTIFLGSTFAGMTSIRPPKRHEAGKIALPGRARRSWRFPWCSFLVWLSKPSSSSHTTMPAGGGIHAIMPGSSTRPRSNASSPRCGAQGGSSIARRRSPDRSKCCAICPVTPTGSPSRTAASSQLTTPASLSAGRTIASTVRTAGRRCASPAGVHPAFSHARAAQGLPPHPPLRALRQRQPADNIATARALLGADSPATNPKQQPDVTPDVPRALRSPCPRCGARVIAVVILHARR